jgi:hypothetical protein
VKAVSRSRVLPSVLAVALIVFAIVELSIAATRTPFWYDESLTVRLSRLPVDRLWPALTAGFEFNPPLIYLLTKASRALPLPELLAARVPPLIGFGLLAATLFLFFRRRVGPWLALAGVSLLPLTAYVIQHAVEARAYLPVLGLSACALFFWQRLSDRTSIADAVGLWLSTSFALLLHVWAILLPLALLAGEAAEAVRARRPRWRILVALACAAPCLAVYPPLLHASKSVVFGGPTYSASTDKLLDGFRLIVPRARVTIAMLCLTGLLGWLRRDPSAGEDGDGFAAPEIAVFVVLLLSPLVPYGYAGAAHGAFMTRYALFALPGFAGLLTAVLHRISRGVRAASQAAAIAGVLGVVLYLPPKIPASTPTMAAIDSIESAANALDPSVPLLLVNPIDVTSFDEQADAALRARAVFVADPALALAYTQTDGIDTGYIRGEPYLGLRIRRVSYDALTREYPRVYLVGKWQALTWLPDKLKTDGWHLSSVGGLRAAPIFEARRPPSP